MNKFTKVSIITIFAIVSLLLITMYSFRQARYSSEREVASKGKRFICVDSRLILHPELNYLCWVFSYGNDKFTTFNCEVFVSVVGKVISCENCP